MRRDMKLGMIIGFSAAAVLTLIFAVKTGMRPAPIVSEQQTEPKKEDAMIDDPTPQIAEKETSKTTSPPVIPDNVRYKTPLPKKEKPPTVIQPKRYHIVQQGDTLSKIASDYYGSITKKNIILEANRDILKSPDKLRVGMRLLIPEIISEKQ